MYHCRFCGADLRRGQGAAGFCGIDCFRAMRADKRRARRLKLGMGRFLGTLVLVPLSSGKFEDLRQKNKSATFC